MFPSTEMGYRPPSLAEPEGKVQERLPLSQDVSLGMAQEVAGFNKEQDGDGRSEVHLSGLPCAHFATSSSHVSPASSSRTRGETLVQRIGSNSLPLKSDLVKVP